LMAPAVSMGSRALSESFVPNCVAHVRRLKVAFLAGEPPEGFRLLREEPTLLI